MMQPFASVSDTKVFFYFIGFGNGAPSFRICQTKVVVVVTNSRSFFGSTFCETPTSPSGAEQWKKKTEIN